MFYSALFESFSLGNLLHVSPSNRIVRDEGTGADQPQWVVSSMKCVEVNFVSSAICPYEYDSKLGQYRFIRSK